MCIIVLLLLLSIFVLPPPKGGLFEIAAALYYKQDALLCTADSIRHQRSNQTFVVYCIEICILCSGNMTDFA